MREERAEAGVVGRSWPLPLRRFEAVLGLGLCEDS